MTTWNHKYICYMCDYAYWEKEKIVWWSTIFKKNLITAPDVEVIAISCKTLMLLNMCTCQVGNKGFQREQTYSSTDKDTTCLGSLSRRQQKAWGRSICVQRYVIPWALSYLTGIKKHYSRKHCDKKWNCEKCP